MPLYSFHAVFWIFPLWSVNVALFLSSQIIQSFESKVLLFISCRRSETLNPPRKASEIGPMPGPSFLLCAQHQDFLSSHAIVFCIDKVMYLSCFH